MQKKINNKNIKLKIIFLIIKFGKKISILNINRNIKQHFQLLLIFYLLKKLIYKLKLLKK